MGNRNSTKKKNNKLNASIVQNVVNSGTIKVEFANFYLQEVDKEQSFVPTSWGAKEIFNRAFRRSSSFDPSGNPRFRLKEVIAYSSVLIDEFKDAGDTYSDVVNYLTEEFNKVNAEMLTDISVNNIISFSGIPLYFKNGMEIYIPNFEGSGKIQGGIITSVKLSKSFFGISYLIHFKLIEQLSDKLELRERAVRIALFNNKINLNDLPVKLITKDIKEELIKRGKLFYEICKKPTYLQYEGPLEKYIWFSTTKVKADGRIMVDGSGFKRFSSNQFDNVNDESRQLDSDDNSLQISEDTLWLCHIFVQGFSFTCKQWGKLLIDNCKQIKFNKDAITKLVMDEQKKNIILALVKNNKGSFTDIIDNKGGGCMFLLHGEPGLGKTLTAEAISEFLERPLYSITMGELGSTPDKIEENLTNVLELASSWNSVILLDEADIFLEKRTTGDIVRNAIVGIFLRLLEYHNGVLFMTSNRIAEFDPAFRSRISVILNYPKLTSETRLQIWKNLLEAAEITSLNFSELNNLPELNGRQIKNVIRNAKILASANGRNINIQDIKDCVALVI